MVDDGGDAPCWAGRVCETCGAVLEAATHVCRPSVHPVPRAIVGFHHDECGDCVAELSCLHNQHLRHRPPFQVRPWVTTQEGRTSHLGREIDCPLCARAELPEGLRARRRAGPFDAATMPAGLLKDHVVADRTWGLLHVLEGGVTFCLQTEPPTTVWLGAGDQQAIPPTVAHCLTLDGSVRLVIDFLTPGADESTDR